VASVWPQTCDELLSDGSLPLLSCFVLAESRSVGSLRGMWTTGASIEPLREWRLVGVFVTLPRNRL
jgi:hypothetical protein